MEHKRIMVTIAALLPPAATEDQISDWVDSKFGECTGDYELQSDNPCISDYEIDAATWSHSCNGPMLSADALVKAAKSHLVDNDEAGVNDDPEFDITEALATLLIWKLDGISQGGLVSMLNAYMNHVRQE